VGGTPRLHKYEVPVYYIHNIRLYIVYISIVKDIIDGSCCVVLLQIVFVDETLSVFHYVWCICIVPQ